MAKQQLARFHERIANRRQDIIHKMTTEIARTYKLVAVEDLNIKGMARNRRLALSVADAGMGEVLRQLAYKATKLVEVSQVVRVEQDLLRLRPYQPRTHLLGSTVGLCGLRRPA